MHTFFNITRATLFLLIAAATFSACDKTFDEPPSYIEPTIKANKSIAELKALYSGTGFLQVNDDIIVEGVVVADDKSGNYYKSIVIQDSTAGILINLEGTNLYTDYPIGRKIFLKCKGLYLGNFGRLVQIGGFIDISTPSSPGLGGILPAQFNNYIVKGSLNNVVAPRTVTIGQLNDNFQNTLIKLELMQFATADVSKPYADAVNKVSVNRTVSDISGSNIIIRTSGYSNFASYNTPTGFGTITAIYTVFNNTKQLIIRDTNDVKLGQAAPTTYFLENFESGTVGANVTFPGWGNFAEAGTQRYQVRSFSGNKYAQISAFGTSQDPVVNWLVTPALNLATITQPNKALLFRTVDAFNNGGTLKAFISTNYNGTSTTPWTATWTELPATISSGNATGFASGFTGSGILNLNAYTGTVYVAFRYMGGDPSGTTNDRTTTFQVDDVRTIGY
jgi:Family of unknown function (DUF5689)